MVALVSVCTIFFGLLCIAGALGWMIKHNAKICETHYLIETRGTRVVFRLVPITDEIEKENLDGTTSMWAVDDSCITPTKYPVTTFPMFGFLQHDIGLIELSEVNWEPIFSTKHDRGEIVASPRYLGTIFNERVSAAVVSLGKDVVEKLNKIASGIQPLHFWIAQIVLAAGLIFIIFQMLTLDLSAVATKLDIIIKLLGGG